MSAKSYTATRKRSRIAEAVSEMQLVLRPGALNATNQLRPSSPFRVAPYRSRARRSGCVHATHAAALKKRPRQCDPASVSCGALDEALRSLRRHCRTLLL
eukprot:1715340-Pleurochrysis_carterae.AAC.2